MQPDLDFDVIIPSFLHAKQLTEILKMDEESRGSRIGELDSIVRQGNLTSRVIKPWLPDQRKAGTIRSEGQQEKIRGLSE